MAAVERYLAFNTLHCHLSEVEKFRKYYKREKKGEKIESNGNRLMSKVNNLFKLIR